MADPNYFIAIGISSVQCDERRIIGIGGLNIDYVFNRNCLKNLNLAEQDEFLAHFIPGSEREIDESLFALLRRTPSSEGPHIRAGGSSFNTIQALAHCAPHTRLGFIGCLGNEPAERPLSRVFGASNIDTRYVWTAHGRGCGSCLSIQVEGDRWMLTTRGANDELTLMLRTEAGPIAEYLAESAVVHVSSLLHPDAPAALADVLSCARALNPALKVSLDPGTQWSLRLCDNQALRRLAELATWVFLNREEFALWEASGALEAIDATIFRKAPEGILVLQRSTPGERTRTHYPNLVLPAGRIIDPTGAGDVFAAGVLGALTVQPSEIGPAVMTGLTLAKRKLQGRPLALL